jgi:hypothetical protein
MALIELALERALSAYCGKRDKAGQAYDFGVPVRFIVWGSRV